MDKTPEIIPGEAVDLKEAVQYQAGSIVSKTLIDKKSGTLTLFAFDRGQGLSEHTAPYDAVVEILDGQAEITVGGKKIAADAGHMVVMPADVPHSVRAPERFKMLLVMIREAS